jgi:hypothetical protein
MATYSFLSVNASINGPGGNITLANGAGAAEEGVTVSFEEDKNTKTIGADGSGMHSLHAGKSGEVTIRLLKVSPLNQALMQMYNLQTSNPALHGQNTINISDTYRGDVIVARECAFKKAPDITYAKDGGMNEWAFDAIYIDETLGTGSPSRI